MPGGSPTCRSASSGSSLPSLPLFVALPLLLRSGVGFWASMALCVVGTLALYALMFWAGAEARAEAVNRKAVVLLSGGLDSMVCAALAREAGFAVIALTVDYGQRHRVELESAQRDRGRARRPPRRAAARPARVRRVGADRRHRRAQGRRRATGIPVTYVPARNTIFLSLALGLAEASGARDIFIGVNALDYSGYPDCRPEFIARVRAAGQPRDQGGGRGRRASPSTRRCST